MLDSGRAAAGARSARGDVAVGMCWASRDSRAHARLEHGTAGEQVLIGTPDDATSRLVVARFAARDDGGRTGIVESLMRTR